MKKKWKVIAALALVAVITATVVLQHFRGLQANLLAVEPRSIARTFKEEGIVIASEEHPVYAVYGGKIVDLPVEEGSTVQKGQLLLTFDTSELVFQVEQLRGQLKSVIAQQELEKSKVSVDKLKELYEAGAISKKEYEDALNTVNSQYYPGQIESLLAQINLLEYRIKESFVYAPADGIVAQLDAKAGMVIGAGQQVMTLFQKDSYLIETFVLTKDASAIGPGLKVSLIQNNDDQKVVFTGTVEKIAPAAVEKVSALGLIEQRIKVTVRPDPPPEVTLKPGYLLDVEFTTSRQENRLVVPKTALFPYKDGDAVWVVRGGKARIQPVKKGFENDRETVIEEGLVQGDMVVLNPQLEGIKEGKRIIKK
ncbi:MAG: efflux RND transporter periplasmic adaptor subunit [Peptococcaceae bacterium]|jgi:HlyD family secretion protein|nr:efflux RND transporter periplasmic adaptor subunit [Peptococcaceae bacterium]MDH7523987.1 efflux RND transporter periplasmic adaptor subunit [Peptococcaceae bacterium]